METSPPCLLEEARSLETGLHGTKETGRPMVCHATPEKAFTVEETKIKQRVGETHASRYRKRANTQG
jgi:hypothetical protein